MKKIIFAFTFFLGIISILFAQTYHAIDPAIKTKAAHALNNPSVEFIENKGQMKDMDYVPVPFVLFKAEAKGVNIYITEKGLTYVFLKMEESEINSSGRKEEKLNGEWNRVDMILKGATIKKENILKESESADFSQYFYAHCPEGITNVRGYKKIIIKEIYTGIDWVIYTNNHSSQRFIKQDFIVHPNADPDQIKLIYEGVGKFEMKNNQIHFENKIGEVQEGKLFCYQGSESNEIQSEYIVKKNQAARTKNQEASDQQLTTNNQQQFSYEIQVQLNEYDKTKELIIDPQLVWSTFYGGSNYEGPLSIDCDAAGNVFIAGYNYSPDFPANTGGGYQGAFVGGANYGDIFILKLNNNGVRLWATNYGGTDTEHGQSITVDPSGNIFVIGFTKSTNFPVLALASAYNQAAKSGFNDAVILKFSNSGTRLWATHYGGTGTEGGIDEQNSICSDINGNIFVTGVTTSNNFPTNPGSGAFFQGAYGGGTGGSYSGDMFISKFSNGGAQLWSSYYGGSVSDEGFAICTDPTGNVFVTGFTTSANFPTLPNGSAYYQAAYSGTSGGSTPLGGDAFIVKFSNTGVRSWATYYGSTGLDMGCSIAADANGNVFVAGYSNSINFPTLNPGGGAHFQATGLGAEDAYILKFTSAGVRQWATLYGEGAQEDFFSYDNLAIDKCNNVYLSFNTASPAITTQASCFTGYNSAVLAGQSDIFITHFSNNGNLLWATFFGGNSYDTRESIALDNSDNLFITGEWTDGGVSGAVNSGTYPLSNSSGGFYDASFNATDDGYIAKFKNNVTSTATATSTNTTGCGCTGTASASAAGGCSSFQFLWYNSSWTQIANTQNISSLCAGTYNAIVRDSAGCSLPDTVTVTITGTGGGPVPNISVGPGLTLNCTTTTSGIIFAVSTTPGVTYLWTGSGIVSGGTNDTAIVNAAGTYTVTITDSNTGCTSTATVVVTNNTTPPNLTSGLPITLGCNPSTGIITVSSTTLGVTYSWTGSGIVSGGTNDTAIVNSIGTYTITVTDPVTGCTSTGTVVVSSNGTLPNVTGGATMNLPCNPNTVAINATSTSAGVTYSWGGPGILSGGTTNTPTVNAAGTYTVTVMDGSGCTNTATVIVTNNNPLPTVTMGNSLTLTCTQTSGSITASSTTAGVIYNWAGNGIVSGGNTNSPTVNAAGTYTVTVLDPVTGCTNTNTLIVSNAPLPIAAVSSNVTIQQGANTTLTVSGGGTYNWQPSTGLNTTTGNTIIASPIITTTYCVEVTDANGCKDTACVTVFVETPCITNKDLQVPNAFSPNADNVNDDFCLQGWNNCIESFIVIIYDRWGEKVFESNKSDFCWDGKFNNKIMEAQVFVYYIKATYTNSKESIVKKGNVSLIK